MEPALTSDLIDLLGASAEAARTPLDQGAGSQDKAEVLRLFDALHLNLLRYAASLGLSAADSEDVIQETFLALFCHLLEGRSRSNLRSWLFTVTHNLALRRRLANARSHRMHEEPENVAAEFADPSPDPEQEFLFTEKQARLQAVLHEMPERDRWCLELRSEGLRYREIARIVGMSLGSVCTSLRRSLDRMTRISER